MIDECQYEDYTISTDPRRLDIDVIHGFLSRSYWAAGIPRDVVVKSIANALCFGLYHHEQQVGFARIITDFTLHAYLCDVFILEDYRGQGLGKWLVDCVTNYPRLQNVRRIMLITADAHELYRQIGFEPLAQPQYMMEKIHIRSWEQD